MSARARPGRCGRGQARVLAREPVTLAAWLRPAHRLAVSAGVSGRRESTRPCAPAYRAGSFARPDRPALKSRCHGFRPRRATPRRARGWTRARRWRAGRTCRDREPSEAPSLLGRCNRLAGVAVRIVALDARQLVDAVVLHHVCDQVLQHVDQVARVQVGHIGARRAPHDVALVADHALALALATLAMRHLARNLQFSGSHIAVSGERAREFAERLLLHGVDHAYLLRNHGLVLEVAQDHALALGAFL